MKTLSLALLIFLLISQVVLSAEISKKKDIAILGTKSNSTYISEDTVRYIDSTISHYFVSQKRFNVLGYGEYRISSEDIDDFISRIREIRAKKAEELGTYDEKFGTVVIKGEDFDRMVNSFLVVVPVISDVTVKKTEIEEYSGSSKYLKEAYDIEVVIDITFINVREGKREASIRLTGEGVDTDYKKAQKKAIDYALGQLSYQVKKIDIFKIKSVVLEVRGDTVLFTLGENMGVKPGDEYEVLTKMQIGKTGTIATVPTALLRVKRVYPDYSEARIVYAKERVTEGDQVVEVAKMGINVTFNAGIARINIPDMNYSIVLVDDISVPPITNYFYVELNQPERNMAVNAGFRVTANLGYRFKAVVDGIAILNLPIWGGIGEAGVLASLYKRRIELQFGVEAGVLYMSTFKERIYRNGLLDFIDINGTEIDFDQDPYVSIYGLGVGIKGTAGLKFVVARDQALYFGISYRLYTRIKKWFLLIEETSGDKMDSVSIGSDSDNVYPLFGQLKSVDISGYEIMAGYSMRF